MEALDTNQVSIDQLPDEMLELVFEMLDSSSLKNCCLVSQKWNSVIGQSLNVMKQLPLALNGMSWPRTFRDTKDFNRRFHTVIIDNVHDWNTNAFKVLSKHGSESQWLQFVDCFLQARHLKMFHKILESFRNAEKITFQETDLYLENYSKAKEIKPANLPRLKSVVLSSSPFIILGFLKLSQLKSLKILEADNEKEEEGSAGESLVTFLATQTKLEELALRCPLNFEMIELSDLEKVKIPLKRLSLTLPEWTSEEFLLAFLARFTGTLEELELGCSHPDSVYEMIFKQFKRLRVVRINVNKIPKENVFYSNLRPNTSVRKLFVRGNVVRNGASLEGFMGNLPNIEILVLNCKKVPGDLMQFVSNNLRHLKSLHVQSASGETFERAHLPSVTTVSFKDVSMLKADGWKKVVKALPNVETMSVQNVCSENSMNSLIFNIFTKGWSNLTHVKIGDGFVAVKRVFNQLLRNCKQIKTVELAESAFGVGKKSAVLRDFKKDGLRLIIHADRDIYKIFDEFKNDLWSNENDIWEDYDDDEDDDEDDDSLFNFNIEVNLINGIAQVMHNIFDSSDSDSEYDGMDDVYFDSDGEMRHWMEDPGDYGIDVDYGFDGYDDLD